MKLLYQRSKENSYTNETELEYREGVKCDHAFIHALCTVCECMLYVYHGWCINITMYESKECFIYFLYFFIIWYLLFHIFLCTSLFLSHFFPLFLRPSIPLPPSSLPLLLGAFTPKYVCPMNVHMYKWSHNRLALETTQNRRPYDSVVPECDDRANLDIYCAIVECLPLLIS